jgi:hypothetical protein
LLTWGFARAFSPTSRTAAPRSSTSLAASSWLPIHPDLLSEWPVETDLVIPKEALSEKLRKSMGEAARKKAANLEVLKQAETD